MDKQRQTELISIYSKTKGVNEEEAQRQLGGMLNTKLIELLTPAEIQEIKAKSELFERDYRDLMGIVSKGGSQFDSKIEKLKKQADTHKKERARIASQIKEVFADGQEDSGELFFQLHEASTQIKQIEDVVSVLELEKKYPQSEDIMKKAQKAFDSGIELIKAYTKANRTEMEKRLKSIVALVEIVLHESSNVFLGKGALSNKLVKVYGNKIEGAVNMKWAELETAANAEVEGRLK